MDRQILIAVDGSAESGMAVEIGLQLAADRGAGVVFLHVAPELAERLYELDPVHGPSLEQVLDADPVLAGAVSRARSKGIPARAEVAGGPSERLGSVSSGVLQQARVPVVVVRPARPAGG